MPPERTSLSNASESRVATASRVALLALIGPISRLYRFAPSVVSGTHALHAYVLS